MPILFVPSRLPLLAACAAAVALSGCGGCAKGGTTTAAQEAVGPAPGAPQPVAVPHDPAPSHPSTATLGSQLMHQLVEEKKGRRPVTLSAERVVEAFQKEGLELKPLKQGLGGPIGARYCAMSHTGKGVAFTICEFESEAAAQAGKQASEKRYGPGGLGRTLSLNKETLLVVRPAVKGEETEGEAKAMTALFQRLR